MTRVPARHDLPPQLRPARRGEVVACIQAEMEKLRYDEVEVDGLGNVIGWMGQGDKIIAIDSHIDTVGVGNRDNWDPTTLLRGLRGPTSSSTAAAAPTRRAAWPPPPTPPRS